MTDIHAYSLGNIAKGDVALLWWPLVAYCVITVTALWLLHKEQDRYTASRYRHTIVIVIVIAVLSTRVE